MTWRIRLGVVSMCAVVMLTSGCGSGTSRSAAVDVTTTVGGNATVDPSTLLVSDSTNPEAGDRPVVLWFWAPG
ncbi:MAG: hypothetical protein EB010_11325 [Acidimicrobiia bacterium]|nr:hypothetical protein [Actinomycetota bacterium]NDB06082.1 hypothetical protein [Acidimicrobiia bacterium]NDD96406.1 hypothetical protein [Actinomycetota bacterium]NDE59986.1 hypothetical protein [Acidimicrobiia bacterium]NDE79947.1 hypothetical protein [Actinomycetota bacterium]